MWQNLPIKGQCSGNAIEGTSKIVKMKKCSVQFTDLSMPSVRRKPGLNNNEK
jgi:hypothetical protein